MSAVIVVFSATISVLVTLYLQKLKRRENNKIVKQSFIKQVNLFSKSNKHYYDVQ